MRKLEKMAQELNDEFKSKCNAAMLKRFGVVTTTEFNIFDMTLSTSREDGKPLTDKQIEFLSGYSDGYAEAMNAVRCADMNSMK